MTVLAGRKETRLNKDTRQFTTPGCSFSSPDSGNTSAAAGFRCGSLLRRTLLRQRGRCTRRIQWPTHPRLLVPMSFFYMFFNRDLGETYSINF